MTNTVIPLRPEKEQYRTIADEVSGEPINISEIREGDLIKCILPVFYGPNNERQYADLRYITSMSQEHKCGSGVGVIDDNMQGSHYAGAAYISGRNGWSFERIRTAEAKEIIESHMEKYPEGSHQLQGAMDRLENKTRVSYPPMVEEVA